MQILALRPVQALHGHHGFWNNLPRLSWPKLLTENFNELFEILITSDHVNACCGCQDLGVSIVMHMSEGQGLKFIEVPPRRVPSNIDRFICAGLLRADLEEQSGLLFG